MALDHGTHHTGPLLARDDSFGGCLAGVPLGAIDKVRSRYKVYVEDFDYRIATAVTFAGVGATATDINVPIAPAYLITGMAPYLAVDPGTKADSGVEIQWNAAISQATYISPETRVLPPLTAAATLMDNRELFFQTRIGLASNATTWDGKVMLGWIITDTSLMVSGSGVPSVAAGGGIGFHIGENGVLGYFAQQGALAAAPTNVTGLDITTMTAANTFQWYELGFRWRCLDNSSGTGDVAFYQDRRLVGTISTGLPMTNAGDVYSVTFAIQNGPAQLSDMAIDYIITGITRAGMTNTSV